MVEFAFIIIILSDEKKTGTERLVSGPRQVGRERAQSGTAGLERSRAVPAEGT